VPVLLVVPVVPVLLVVPVTVVVSTESFVVSVVVLTTLVVVSVVALVVVPAVGLQPPSNIENAAVAAITLIIIIKFLLLKNEASVNPGLPAVEGLYPFISSLKARSVLLSLLL